MSFIWCLGYLFFTLSSLNIVRTVPPDYCLSPLNQSDCNMAPKTVYSYYKPGSRCERETWRGCPTANKFDNEYLCSLNCIFRKRQEVQDDFDDPDPCNIPLNQSICGEQKIVITHVDGFCKRAWWGGCPTHNIFDEMYECLEACDVITTIYPNMPVTTPRTPSMAATEKLNLIIKEIEDIIKEELRTTTDQVTETETESTTETDSVTEAEETTTEAPGEITTNDEYDEVLNP